MDSYHRLLSLVAILHKGITEVLPIADTKDWGFAQITARTHFSSDDAKFKRSPYTIQQGEAVWITPDDMHPLMFYSRLQGAVEVETDYSAGRGDNFLQRERLHLRTVFLASVAALQTDSYGLYQRLGSLPFVLQGEVTRLLGLRSATVAFKRAETNLLEVFSTEWPGEELKIGPEYLMLAVEWDVHLSFLQECQKPGTCTINPMPPYGY